MPSGCEGACPCEGVCTSSNRFGGESSRSFSRATVSVLVWAPEERLLLRPLPVDALMSLLLMVLILDSITSASSGETLSFGCLVCVVEVEVEVVVGGICSTSVDLLK